MKVFNKILIANRGEIAGRIIRSAKELNITTVAVYSDADKDSLFVRQSDEAYYLGGNELSESYLNIDKIIDIAKKSGAEAIHPGYGFLAENPKFIDKCQKAGIIFIGPHTKAMDIMGNKIKAREFVSRIKVTMTASVQGDMETLLSAAKNIPMPLLIKAAAGGGGKGMRIIHDEKKLKSAIESTSREAKSYFGDGTVYIEQYIENPRHIEVQVLGDDHGNVVHLFERECSIQRRYQKIIEESPSATLTDSVRNSICNTAVKIAKEIGYNNAGTIEFLVDSKLNYYFLEMNTRVQVEHPVTEMVTGIDIVREQILVAAGNKLSFSQEDVKQSGHAIECRIYAEDYENDFLPSPGRMIYYNMPHGKNIRVDSAYDKAAVIESFFDPMISKLIVWGKNREEARLNSIDALQNYIVHGIKNNISFLINFMLNKDYISNSISTSYCESHKEELLKECSDRKLAFPAHIPVISYALFTLNNSSEKRNNIWEEIGYWRNITSLNIKFGDKNFNVEYSKTDADNYIFNIEIHYWTVKIKRISSNSIELILSNSQFSILNSPFLTFISFDNKGDSYVSSDGNIFSMHRNDFFVNEDVFSDHSLSGNDANHILSPIPGKIIKINVKEGENIKKGDNLVIVEAMKMENHLLAHKDAVISRINVKVGDMVDNQTQLIELEDSSD